MILHLVFHLLHRIIASMATAQREHWKDMIGQII